MKNKSIELKLLSEQSLHQAIIPGLVSYCPSMDLIALGTIDNQVQILRLNGQEVYKSNQRNNDIKVQSLAWKPDGQLLAIAWSDGSVKLVGAESKKVVHQFNAAGDDGITQIGWASSLTATAGGPPLSTGKAQSWNELLAQDVNDGENNITIDLPRDLAQIDIETSLPRLSVLASGGTSEDVFSSRASLEALFRPFDTKDVRAVDVMVVGSRTGNLHLSVYDSFVIGSFTTPSTDNSSSTSLVAQASHRECSTRSLLLSASEPVRSLYFAPMDLRFVSSSSDYLSLLASRSSALQNLLRYINEVHRLMVIEWESTRDLPGKFLRNIDEDLQEKENRNIVQALYHSVATGHTFPTVKEWLVDELAERGHKRWDKAVTSGLQNLKQLVHENMLPALDRCSVILSRFAGIAKFRGSSDTLGFTAQQISLLHDSVACLHLIASKVLIQVIDELEMFTAFSVWLRHEIDRLASEGSSTTDDDAAEKESSLDHSKVLQYIQIALKTSPLASYLGSINIDPTQNESENIEQRVPMFDLLSKQVKKMEQGQQYEKRMLRQEYLAQHLSQQAGRVFQQIAEAEKRNVLFGDVREIGVIGESTPLDMKVNSVDPASCATYIAHVDSKSHSTIRIICVALAIEKGISRTTSIRSTSLRLGNGAIRDVKFYDNSMLILWTVDGESPILLSIPYKSSLPKDARPSTSNLILQYSPYSPGKASQIPNRQAFTSDQVMREFAVDGAFARSDGFVAGKIEVREGSNDKDVDKDGNGRIVIVAHNGLKYRVYNSLLNPCRDNSKEVDEGDDVEMSQEV